MKYVLLRIESLYIIVFPYPLIPGCLQVAPLYWIINKYLPSIPVWRLLFRRRRLRSADTRTLLVSRTCTNLGDRAFSAAGPPCSLQLSADGPQTAGLVIQPSQTVAEDVYIVVAGSQRGVITCLTAQAKIPFGYLLASYLYLQGFRMWRPLNGRLGLRAPVWLQTKVLNSTHSLTHPWLRAWAATYAVRRPCLWSTVLMKWHVGVT